MTTRRIVTTVTETETETTRTFNRDLNPLVIMCEDLNLSPELLGETGLCDSILHAMDDGSIDGENTQMRLRGAFEAHLMGYVCKAALITRASEILEGTPYATA